MLRHRNADQRITWRGLFDEIAGLGEVIRYIPNDKKQGGMQNMSQYASGQVASDDIAAAEAPSTLPRYHFNLFISNFASLDAIRLEKALVDDWGFIRARVTADPVTQALTLEWEYPREQDPAVKTQDPLSGTFDIRFIRCTSAMKKVLHATSGGAGVLSSHELWLDDRRDVDTMTAETGEMRAMLLMAIAQLLPERQCSLVQVSSDPQWFEEMASNLATTAGSSASPETREERIRLFVVAPESLDVTRLEKMLRSKGLLSANLQIDPTTRTITCKWEAPADYVEEPGVPTQGLPNLSGVFTMPFIRCTGDVQAVMRRDGELGVMFEREELWMDDAEDIYTMSAAAQGARAALCTAILDLVPEHQRALIRVPADPKYYEEQSRLVEILNQLEQQEEEPTLGPFRTLLYWATMALVAYTVIQFIAEIL